MQSFKRVLFSNETLFKVTIKTYLETIGFLKDRLGTLQREIEKLIVEPWPYP